MKLLVQIQRFTKLILSTRMNRIQSVINELELSVTGKIRYEIIILEVDPNEK